VQTNESVEIYPSIQEGKQQKSLETQLVSDNNLSEIIANNNTTDGLYQLQANTADSTCLTYNNYNSYGQEDSMEALLDMPDNSQTYGYHSTNTDMNETHLYTDNINTSFSLPSTMIPIQVGVADQDTHGSYYTQDFLTAHQDQEQEQHQVVNQDLLLCKPFDPSGTNQDLESNANSVENPIIQKQEKPDTNNMLLCQPFEPSDNNNVMTDNDNISNTWLQDGTQYQDLNQRTRQEYSESIMYSQIPQSYEQDISQSIHHNQQFISSTCHEMSGHASHLIHRGISQEISRQELQHIEMYQHQMHRHNPEPINEMNQSTHSIQYLTHGNASTSDVSFNVRTDGRNTSPFIMTNL